jgi:hypothetical protein
MRAQLVRCRELYMDDVDAAIDKSKIRNMQRLSQEKYEEVSLKMDIFEDEDIARSLAGLPQRP